MISVCKIDNMIQKNFALTTLSHNPEYFDEVMNLIQEEFHYNENQSYEKDFAPLVNPLNFENCFLLIDENTNAVVAHLAICPRSLIKSNAEMKVAFIGGIATQKQYRGQNLFKFLMNHAIELYSEKVALFILWSDIEGLYEKFQFLRAGGFLESGKKSFSNDESPLGFEKTTFTALSEKDFQKIIELYSNFNEKFFFTVKRLEKDWSIIKEMNTIDLYIKRNSHSQIDKYFCINKGRDLTNIIHEFSCLSTEYISFIKEISAFRVWLPETEQDKTLNEEIFYTAFFKISSQVLFNNFLQIISNNKLFIKSIDNESIAFEFNDKKFEATPKEFLQYIFGPKPLEEFLNFKLSLYVAGADSV